MSILFKLQELPFVLYNFFIFLLLDLNVVITQTNTIVQKRSTTYAENR